MSNKKPISDAVTDLGDGLSKALCACFKVPAEVFGSLSDAFCDDSSERSSGEAPKTVEQECEDLRKENEVLRAKCSEAGMRSHPAEKS